MLLPSKMILRSSVLVLTLLFSATANAQFASNISWYKGGEADSSVSNGGSVSTSVDSGSAANNLGVNAGTPTWSTAKYPPSGNLRFGASTTSYTFDGNSGLFSGSVSTTATQNFGLEAWVNPTSASGTQAIFLNGNGSNGYGLYINGGDYQVLMGVNTFFDTGVAVTPNVWTEFALVDQFHSNTMYINGISTGGTFTATPTTPAQNVFLGDDSGGDTFTGQIDEARIFSFAGFTVTELNYQTAVVPEPAAWGGVGSAVALGLAMLKRRKTTTA
jgi:hypothetical protein